MESRTTAAKPIPSIDVESTVALIAETQKADGEIPWCRGGKTDPWDHVEAAMGLSIGGYPDAARAAFEWMARVQHEDGSWYAAYRDGIPEDLTRDTNFATYLAVGVYHHFLMTGDRDVLDRMWTPVRRGIDFALRHQARGGEIFWAVSPDGEVDRMALLTGSCSVYMGLKCALRVAGHLGHRMEVWEAACRRLGAAIRYKPHHFNMTKSRYAMDWFYPVLTGVLTGAKARCRIERLWKRFVINGQGVRCVSDRPWVTIAETAELSLALSAMGNKSLSHIVFNWIIDKRYEDGSYWCGFTVPDMVVWPGDRLTWTNAAVLIAADALYHLTPACRLFHHDFWAGSNRHSPKGSETLAIESTSRSG